MYILGWDVDFGHMEAVNLISSPKYSEKQIGYLAVTLMLTENSELLRLVVNSMRKDLDDPNEIHNCLALHAIANIGGREMAESLANDVQRLLVSGRSSPFVKKKAALCLLRLFRKHQDVLHAQEWASKVLIMMDDHDLGVTLAVTTLVLALAQQFPEAYIGCVTEAINRMHKIVIEKEYSPDYVYYKVPVPWLQVKLLRLLQYYPPPEDRSLRSRLTNVLQTIINNAQDIPKNVQHNNAQNAVLFEAINLAIHLDPESEIVTQAAVLLSRFISSKETNIRYLGLETMTHLAGFAYSLDAIKKHQETIIQSLKDKDISVRRRALDLLYSMCDATNSRVIVSELLHYLTIADFAIREEMVLKIAILTEKFADDYSWYVDVILQLITIAGDHVSAEVWYRVVQIVTNIEDLQVYAARTVLNALKSPTCHENSLKVGGYILGEFGHLIANDPGCSPLEQFMALHSKFGMCTVATRALLLTTYLKFVNLFPEIKDEIIRVFKQYCYVLDVELQQRACEYLAIVTQPTDDLLQTVCEEMPPFPERESALLSRLQKKVHDTEDKRTWNIGGKDANKETPVARKTDRRRSTIKSSESLNLQSGGFTAGNGTSAANAGGGLDDLLGLADPMGPQINLDLFYNRLVIGTSGVLHEDQNIQIGIKSEYHNHLGRLAVFYGNKSMATIQNLDTSIQAGPESKITLVQPIASSIPPATQYHQMYNVECVNVLTDAPSLLVEYDIGGQPIHLSIRLPLVLTKFMSPVELSATDFFSRWRQIGGPPRENQVIFKSRGVIVVQKAKEILTGLHFGVLEGVDPNPNNLVGASIYSSIECGKVGCLLRLEPNLEQEMYRLTIRTTNDAVTAALTAQCEHSLQAEY
ncbi:hypothetical protein HK104_006138 [Borealophlyctis nickersoniae]|nr:hypothetical protein HK104_006138 [Borealophlyctis nickersoniae]